MTPAPPRRHVLMTLVMSALIVAAFVWPRGENGTICTFKRLAGVSCPGCGMTRAVVAIVDGHWADSARYHLFGFVAAAVVFGLWAYGVASFYKPSPPILSLVGLKTAVVAGVVLAAYLAYWVLRILNGTAP